MAEPIRQQDIPALAAQYFPAALLYTGSRTEALSALTEALAAAAQDGSDAVLPHVLRICGTRTVQPDAALTDAVPALSAVWKLPPGSRRDLALHCSGIPDAVSAKARGISDAEFAQRLEKAMRQLTFLGGTADPDALRGAVSGLTLTAEESGGIRDRWTQAMAEREAQASPVREITRSEQPPAKQNPLHRKIPLWGAALSILCAALTLAVVLLLIDRSRLKQHPPAEFSVSDAEENYTVQDLAHLSFISMDDARQKVLEALGTDDTNTVFSNVRLDTAKTPVTYRVTCITDETTQYEFTLDARTGEITKRTEAEAVLPLRTEGWLPLDEMRARALSYTKLDAALTVREQLGTDGGRGYYRFRFQDADGKIYTVQLSALDGILLKYSVEMPPVTDTAGFIPLDAAKQQAVARVGDLTPQDVVFTKEKLDGAVYLIAFTLNDGTQYALELDARTGMTNTLDVHPVSADSSRAIGILEARDIALEQAGITAEDVQQFTKAKIDRSNGIYVYELAFETLSYDYELTLNTETGEIIKYKASYK